MFMKEHRIRRTQKSEGCLYDIGSNIKKEVINERITYILE